MPNNIQTNGTIATYYGPSLNDRDVIDLTHTIECTSSLQSSPIIRLDSGSVTSLATSSLSNLRMMIFANRGTGSVEIASDSAFTKRICYLSSSGSAVIPWSGSEFPLYARGTDQSGSVLKYILRGH